MPIKIQKDLPVREILEKENIFVMDENRAIHQDIRPIQILILNLMPLKEETELQLLRSLSNTPLQVDVTFMTVASHESKNTSMSHLNQFYKIFPEVREKRFDGMIILAGVDGDYGLVRASCNFHNLSLLGSAGMALLSLRTEKAYAETKDVRTFLAQSNEPENPSCKRI